MKLLGVRATAGSWDVSGDRNKGEGVEQGERERARRVGPVRKGSRRRVSVGVFMSVWAGREGWGGWRLLSAQSK